MAENALTKKLKLKLKLKAGQRAAIVGAPPGYLDQIQPMPDGVEVSETLAGAFDWVQVFVRTQAELEGIAPQVVASLKPESLLWISFPKGSSKIQTDLTRDKGWESLQKAELKWVTLVSVDPTWSAFALRPYKPGETRQQW